MKKVKGIVCVAALAVAVGCLNGCSFSIGMKSSYKYSDSDKYAVGDVEITDKIDKLDIDYLSGDVKIVKADILVYLIIKRSSDSVIFEDKRYYQAL